MSVVVVGLQHTQAPLALLEEVSIADCDLRKALIGLNHSQNIQEAVVLSSCLRTEVYAVVDRFYEAVAEIYDVLSEQSGRSVKELSMHAVIRLDDDVTEHLFAVTSGLESVVTGESGIVGQVRRAFERAKEEGACGPVLSALFRHALRTSKRVRTETAITKGITSFAYTAVTIARGENKAGLRGARVVVVGAGEMAIDVCRALSDIAAEDAPHRVVVLNRSEERAKALVGNAAGAPFEMRAASLDDAERRLIDADVVLTAVAARSHVLVAEHFAGVNGRQVIVDLGVPRNVDPAVGRRDGISLLDMDTLIAAVGRALDRRAEESKAARSIVDSEVERFRIGNRQRGAAPTIVALRARLESLRMAELERNRAPLADLTEQQWDQVDRVTRSVLAKLLHERTMLLKNTAGTPRGERLIETMCTLFDL